MKPVFNRAGTVTMRREVAGTWERLSDGLLLVRVTVNGRAHRFYSDRFYTARDTLAWLFAQEDTQ